MNMNRFSIWLDGVAGKRTDISSSLYPSPQKELSAAALHFAIINMCAEYVKQLPLSQTYRNNVKEVEHKRDVLVQVGLTRSQNYKDVLSQLRKLYDIECVSIFKDLFPDSMFMSYDDFTALCGKYNLICGTFDEYLGDIPEHNFKEIETVHEILLSQSSKYILKINNGYMKILGLDYIPPSLRGYYSDYIRIYNDFIQKSHVLKADGQTIPILNLRSKDLTYMDILIAAPSDKIKPLEQAKSLPVLLKEDPIVFQFIGNNSVMIHSKWGAEANDYIFSKL